MVDWEGFLRAQAGEREAVTQLVEAHMDELYTVCYYLTHNRHEAEDLAQEAMLKLLQHLPEIRNPAGIRAWLRTVAARSCFNQQRRQRPVQLWDDEEIGLLPAQGSVEADAERREQKRSIENALAALPPHYRTVIILRHYRQLSYEEIAAAVAAPVTTVKTLLYRARRALRDILEEGGGGHAVR